MGRSYDEILDNYSLAQLGRLIRRHEVREAIQTRRQFFATHHAAGALFDGSSAQRYIEDLDEIINGPSENDPKATDAAFAAIGAST